MKRQHVLIWAAWLTHAVAWFLPVEAEGATFPHGLPGWQALRVASCAVWRCEDIKFEHWYNAVFAAVSAATTPLFILGSVWVVWFGWRTVRRTSAWIAAAAFVINAHWYIFFGPDRKDLRIGYFLWWSSFLLLALGLFDLSGSKVDKASQ
jgi:hypothetical protein